MHSWVEDSLTYIKKNPNMFHTFSEDNGRLTYEIETPKLLALK